MTIKNFLILLCALIVGFGCAKSKRDNPFDPANTPFVVTLQKPAYDVREKGIVMSWQYYGRAVKWYRVTRRDLHSNVVKEWEFATPPELIDDPLSTDHDAQPVKTFVDTDTLYAGARYAYEVEIEDAVAKTPQIMGTVQIPGFPIQDVSLDLMTASAMIQVGPASESPVTYEIVRRVGGVPDVRVFRTDDVTISRSVDTNLGGNTLYQYIVRSTMADGLVFESAPFKGAFFYPDLAWTLPIDAGAYPYVITRPNSSGLYYLSVTNTQAHLGISHDNDKRFETDFGSMPFSQPLRPNHFAFESHSQNISLGVGPNGVNIAASATHYYVASIVNSEVYLDAYLNFYQQSDVSIPISWHAEPWPVSDMARVALDEKDGLIYVVAEDQLRIFSPDMDQLDQINLGITGSIGHFAVDDDQRLWAVLPDERRVLKSPPALVDGADFQVSQWEEIVLPPGTSPFAITGDYGNLFFVLDAENKRVLVYLPNGEVAYTFDGLDGLDFQRDGKYIGNIVGFGSQRGGLVRSVYDKIYVMDAWGKVQRFNVVLDASDL